MVSIRYIAKKSATGLAIYSVNDYNSRMKKELFIKYIEAYRNHHRQLDRAEEIGLDMCGFTDSIVTCYHTIAAAFFEVNEDLLTDYVWAWVCGAIDMTADELAEDFFNNLAEFSNEKAKMRKLLED
jgi:hypothetical protein